MDSYDGGQTMTYLPTDYTNLRGVLDGSVQASAFEPVMIEASESGGGNLTGYQQNIADIISLLSTKVGDLTLTAQEEQTEFSKYQERYTTNSGNTIGFSCNTETGNFIQIIVNTSGSQPNDEWPLMYQTVLSSQILGLSETAISTLSANSPSNGGGSAEGITVSFGQVSNVACMINFS